jgi:methylthioribulose-1-phosphate dehydratase
MPESFQNMATQLADIGRAFYSRGWMLGTSGNLSTLVTPDPFRVAITASGRDKGSLNENQILEIDGDGAKVRDNDGEPSSETRLHLGLIQTRHTGAVLHTHSTWSTIVSDHYQEQRGLWIEGYEMLKGLEGVDSHEHREWIPILENSQDMDELWNRMNGVLDQSRSHGVLIRRHGLYTWGPTLADARRHVEILEFLVEVAGRHLAIGTNGR